MEKVARVMVKSILLTSKLPVLFTTSDDSGKVGKNIKAVQEKTVKKTNKDKSVC